MRASPLNQKPFLQFIALPGLGVSGAVLAVYLVTLAPDLTWHNNGADGGDLITAAATLGVAHPSGYPTYILLARLFQLIPAGSLAYRTTLLSAAAGALAVVAVAGSVKFSFVKQQPLAWAAGLLTGLAFGLSPLLWSQAIIAEVYALHTFFVAALILIIVCHEQVPQPGLRRLGSGLLGLAIGNHLTAVFLLPPWVWLSSRPGGRWSGRAGFESVVALALGLSVYLYLPIRANAQPVINWGDATTPAGLWWIISGQTYRHLAFGLPADLWAARFSAWAGLLMAQFSWPGLLLAFYGFFFAEIHAKPLKLITLWMMIAYSAFAIGYGTADSQAYLLPAFLALGLWFGWGTVALLQKARALRPGLIALIALTLFATAAHHLPQLDASRDTAAMDFGRRAMTQAPPDALIVTTHDRDTFTLWYFQYALRERPDVIIVVEPLLRDPWYQTHLRRVYPQLAIPTVAFTLAELLAANPRPVCRADQDPPTTLTCSGP